MRILNKQEMETVFMNLVGPELIALTSKKNNKLISYGYFFDTKLVYSIAWIHKYYFHEPVMVYLPKCVDLQTTLTAFNELVGEFTLTAEEVCYCSLQQLEAGKANCVVIYGFADFIFNNLNVLNRRRMLTHLKKPKSKVYVFSYTQLHSLDIPVFDAFEYFKLQTPRLGLDFSYIDFLDNEIEIESLVDLIVENREKRVYLALCVETSKILQVESALKENGLVCSRKENGTGVVIQSLKTIEKSFLKNKYDVYIFITREFEYPLDILVYLKELNGTPEVYFDSSILTNIKGCLREIHSGESQERVVIKDSCDYDTYAELASTIDTSLATVASEGYYVFESSQTIKEFDLKNLTKSQYDVIRNFVKLRLLAKIDMEIKTCQLSSPSSPRDRSKKLNSLSNKISSYDYRCEITCEIFKDYSIGVVVWNEMFSDRKTMNPVLLKSQVFIYQTTSGKWKYTAFN